MKIVFICSSFGGGGAEKVAVKLSSALADIGHDVSYVYWKTKEGQEYKLDANVKLNKLSATNPLARAWGISKLIKLERPDVVLSFTDIPNIITYFACMLAWPYRCLRIPNVRIDVAEKYRNLNRTPQVRLLSFLHGLSCKNAPMVLVNSKDSGTSLCDYYQLSEDKVHCIYNPVFDELPHSFPSVQNINDGDKKRVKAINIGRLTKAKDQQMLIRAIDHAVNELGVDIELDIYGEGDLYDELQKEIVNRGLSDRIYLKSFDPDIEKKIKHYHLFLFASRWEGLPNALIEALGSGVQVISTNCPSGPREILDDGRFGTLVDIGNYQQMAQAIARLYPQDSHVISNNTNARKMSDDLKKHLEQFTIPFVTSQYTHLVSRKINDQ
ncbi:glycosyltransferase [Vreelandella populi]|uniref:Glycosyltransferase n=1 Tax=Vreelandella populi TaxID=2498858 RepID=A0A433LF66_9GAMM|nr:glycosyltransferase [Halomonas populi]RUR35571.1 glycosyltransferase [Halomonas populi]RUR47761.1 glycosyltransferase [Halomonas populi]RUR54376.1 glycosyltransferase [Halomonas populi]